MKAIHHSNGNPNDNHVENLEIKEAPSESVKVETQKTRPASSAQWILNHDSAGTVVTIGDVKWAFPPHQGLFRPISELVADHNTLVAENSLLTEQRNELLEALKGLLEVGGHIDMFQGLRMDVIFKDAYDEAKRVEAKIEGK